MRMDARERDNVVYWKTKRKIRSDLQCACLSRVDGGGGLHPPLDKVHSGH